MVEPTNWNIKPRHLTKQPKRHYKTFLRPPEEPEPAPEPFPWPEVEIPAKVAAMPPQELLIKSFALGVMLAMIYVSIDPDRWLEASRFLR